MPQPTEELENQLQELTRPGARDALVRRGLARGLIWRGGRLPDGAPNFSVSLTEDLLDHGYLVLANALRLRERRGSTVEVERGLRVAAESIESAVRRGEQAADRDFHLVVASCAFHLAHFGARAYCLVPSPEINANLSTPERALVSLMRRNFVDLRAMCANWLRNDQHQDSALAARLEESGADALDDVELLAITANFIRSLSMLLTALDRGDADFAAVAIRNFSEGSAAAAEIRHIPLWWANTLARHLADGLWDSSLHARIPSDVDGPSGERWLSLRRRYIDVLRGRVSAEVDLWPSQWEAAARCIDPNDDLVVALPTSAGKTRVAELCILRTLADQRRVIYVTPLRALSAQLERTLGGTFRPLGQSVTTLYGASGVAAADIASLRDADIVVATPEKLDFAMRVDPTVLDDVGLIVLDEGHMIGLGTREIRYEVLVQRLLRRPDVASRRIVCLSAIFAPSGGGNHDVPPSAVDVGPRTTEARPLSPISSASAIDSAFSDFTSWIRSDAPGRAVMSEWRPTRQRTGILRWGEVGGRLSLTVDDEEPFVPRFVLPEQAIGRRRNSFPQDEAEFVLAGAKAFLADDHRVMIYCPQRRSVEALGKTFLSIERQGHFALSRPAQGLLARALRIGREWLGPTHVALLALEKGVALHHGALPRPFLAEIEELLQRRIIRLVIASPTLAQGIDLSCSVLLFRSIYRIGNQTIGPEEFANVVGRAGRAHVDLDGISVYPVFDRGRIGSRRIAAFRRLVRESATRRLESGLVLLVEQLVGMLSQALGASTAEVRTYVLAVDSTWDLEIYALDPQGQPTDRELLAPTLAELDAAILASVEDLDGTPEKLADALDSALRGSLWARRLRTRPADAAALARDALVGRAQWIWTRTTAAERRAYHAAGLGYASGQFLDAQRDVLLALLVSAESALLRGAFSDFSKSIVVFAGLVRDVSPFAFEDAPVDWENALTSWVTGDSVSVPPLVGDASEIVAFLQGDVVYRLVWAVEAVRLHAIQTGAPDAESLTGVVASVLTYGVCTRPGIVIAQAGLSSRAMVQRLVATFGGGPSAQEHVVAWIAETRSIVDTPGFWPDSETSALWATFVGRWTSRAPSQWREYRAELGVEWRDSARSPATDERVSLVHDYAEDQTFICAEDLTPLGQLSVPLSERQRSATSGTVARDGRHIVITGFYPS